MTENYEGIERYNILTESGIDVTRTRAMEYLTESGIDIPEDNIIREGKVVELAREAKGLLENGDKDGFWDLLMKKEYETLDKDERFMLMQTQLFPNDPLWLEWTIYDELNEIETFRADCWYEDDIEELDSLPLPDGRFDENENRIL